MVLPSPAAQPLLHGEIHQVSNISFLKNKTTKTIFVVEIQFLMYGFISIISHNYFFLVVFFAFFAGAFFVAMYSSPPFIME
jgi:hypothetical protein